MTGNPCKLKKFIAAGGLLWIFCLTGCSSESPSEQPQSTTTKSEKPSPSATAGEGKFIDPERVDRQDKEDVAEAVAIMAHSWDTKFDTTQTHGLMRAKELMSKEFAETIIAPERNAEAGSWLQADAHEAYSVPHIEERQVGAHAPDYGPNRDVFGYEVTWNWIGRDGAEFPGEGKNAVQVFVERTGEDQPWEVAGYVVDSTS